MPKLDLKTAIKLSMTAGALAALLMGQSISPASADNPSFSCGGALVPAEAVICSNDNLSALDRTLAADYRKKLDGLTASQRAALENAEKLWIAERNSCGPNVSCISNAYAVRISQLGTSAPAPAPTAAATYITAALDWTGGKAQFFLNDGTYIRYDIGADRADDGYPKPINDSTWSGMAPYARLIAAGCNGPNGKAYFFLSNGQYLRYDIAADKVDPGYPKTTDEKTWPGMGRYASMLASALNWKDGKIQFFLKNGQYIRYDVAADRADDGYPQAITESSWPGVASYKARLAGMINPGGKAKAYMFLSNGEYLRYDEQADKADPGYPQPINDKTWPGMGSALHSK